MASLYCWYMLVVRNLRDGSCRIYRQTVRQSADRYDHYICKFHKVCLLGVTILKNWICPVQGKKLLAETFAGVLCHNNIYNFLAAVESFEINNLKTFGRNLRYFNYGCTLWQRHIRFVRNDLLNKPKIWLPK